MMENYSQIMVLLQNQGMQLLGGVVVLIIGFILAHWVIKLISRNEKFVRIDPTLKSFLGHLLRLVLYMIVVLTAANVMGIPMTSIVALVASGGVAVSLAMQGALSNLVGGFMLLLLKPIKVNEYVKAGDIEGTVKAIGAFYTELITPDNRHISMPNSNLTNTAIINYTREGTRRMDVTFSVSYNTDIAQVKETLMQVANSHSAVLTDPAPTVRLAECADSGMNFTIRLWCKNADYWDIHFYLLEEGKRALDAAHIEIPYPQMDVHMR